MSSWTTKHQLFTKEETTTQKQEGREELPVCSFHPPECQTYEVHLTKEGNLLPPPSPPFSRCLAWREGTGRNWEGGNRREVRGILRPLAAVVSLYPEGERTRAHTRQLGCASLA